MGRVDQELRIEYVDAALLQQHPDNANNGDVDAIARSIRANGLYDAVKVQRSTGYVLVGNHTFLAQLQQGLKKIPVIYLDVDDNRAKSIMLVDNRLTRQGYDDEAMVSNLLEELFVTDEGLEGTGYDSNDLEYFRSLMESPLTAEDFDLDSEVDKNGGNNSPRLNFSITPVITEDGKVYDLTLMRPNLKHITLGDFLALRKALGQPALSAEEIASFGVPDWDRH